MRRAIEHVLASGLMAAAMCAGFPDDVLAQQVVQDGSTASGYFAGEQSACWQLQTEVGSLWRIVIEGRDIYLRLGRGSCEQFTLDDHDDSGGLVDRRTRIEFASGGGLYIIKGSSAFGEQVPYQLRVEKLDGLATTGLLPAGRPITPWLTPGWTPASASSSHGGRRGELVPGNVFKDCSDVCPEMVVVPSGAFTMGSPADEAGRLSTEGPRHPVAFRAGFAIGRFEVTFAEWDACVTAGGCVHRPEDRGWGRGRRPVIEVTWNDAMEYVAWLSQRTGQRYTLPSEAEWEYAARAGSDTPWHTGQALLTDDANILNTFSKTVPVGSYPPNAFGLHDVHGNVSEWTLDCLDTGYIGVPNDGSAATAGDCSRKRINRGGDFTQEPANVRSSSRWSGPQTQRYGGVGFRVARAL